MGKVRREANQAIYSDELGFETGESSRIESVKARITELEAELSEHLDRTLDAMPEDKEETRKIKAKIKSQKSNLTQRVQKIDVHQAVGLAIAQLQAITSVLPAELRSKIGGRKKIASIKTARGVESELKDSLEVVDKVMEKYLCDQTVKIYDTLRKQCKQIRTDPRPQ